jgi:hypothetical protein
MEIQLVRVTRDDLAYEVWVAATTSQEACNLVLDKVPEGWSAALSDTRLTSQEREDLKLQTREIRKLR